MLTDRVLRTLRRHDLIPAGAASWPPCQADPTRWRSCTSLPGCSAPASSRLPVSLTSTTASVETRRTRTRRSAAPPPRALGLPIDVESIDVAARARDEGSSIEAAARAARYEFLERAAARLDADRIAVGHTRDDQAETYLLRLLRGAGPRGLGGIRPRVGIIVRPLSTPTRADVLEYLRAPHHSVARRRVQRGRRHPAQPRTARADPFSRRALYPGNRGRSGARSGDRAGRCGMARPGCNRNRPD